MTNKRLCQLCYIFLVPVFILLTSCGEKNEAPDVSNIKVSLQTARFDRDLYAIDTNHIGAGLRQLAVKYPDFLNFYLDTLLGLGVNGNYSDTNKLLRELLTNKDYIGLRDTIAKHYPDTKAIENELVKGFQFMTHYYPDYKVPKIIFLSFHCSLRRLSQKMNTKINKCC